MFTIATEPLDVAQLAGSLPHPAAGAIVTFEGRVRNHNDGLTVTALEYQAYQPLAHSEGLRILREAKSRFSIIDCRCAHRIGALGVGDIAVWVGAVSAHRADAFSACRYIIDEVKKRVPIWKKEIPASGDSYWVACHQTNDPGTPPVI